MAAPTAQAQTIFTVNSTADDGDFDTSDGVCDTDDSADDGPCTLRAAIQQANSATGNSEIEFNISGPGPHTIQPGSALPTITEPLFIRGNTEPDYTPGGSPVVEIDGQNAGTGVSGLTFGSVSAGSVGALAIINFDDNGLLFDASNSIPTQNSYIGVAADGSAAGNGSSGVEITNGASGNLINGNVISNNGGRGIFIGPVGGEANNTVVDNLIGTSPDGTSDMGNFFEGVLTNGAIGTLIGVDSNGNFSGNVISGNGRAGVSIVSGGATIQANNIGTNESGDASLSNDGNGVELSNGTSGVLVGGTMAGAGNVISANVGHGVLITGSGSTSNVVQGNNIGTNAAGDVPLGNALDGVRVENGASDATIGGTASGAENVIADNENEIYIDASSNDVQGNFIGTNANGDDLGSGFNAIDIDSGSNNFIGGSTSGAGNVIGFTLTNSVSVSGTNNVVRGNFIGTNPNGDSLPTTGTAVRLFGSGHVVGGTSAGEGNTITNSSFGVGISTGTGHTIRGNRIFDNSQLGIDFNRDGVTGNDAGDSDDGVNRLQNFPEIQSATITGGGDVEVTYLVDSNPSLTGSGASDYNLTIDFYKADADDEEGEAYLGTDTYTPTDYSSGCSTPPCSKTVTFTPQASVTESDDVVATATDGNGNTSEFTGTSQQLPVELAGFEAQRSGSESVTLQWRTLSETNNAGFEVQRATASADGSANASVETSQVETPQWDVSTGESWKTIAHLEGAGTTDQPQSYQFEDTDLPYAADRVRYRLRQIDTDGTESFSEPVTIARQVTAAELLPTYPNPARSQAMIRFATPERQDVHIALYDMLGRRVQTVVDTNAEGRTEAQLDVSNLASGTYFVRMQTDGFTDTQRLTVVR
ncbi:T9SS type A sorting domain-containing protein [Longimonas halophila]|nr:T9SS type A sorting domain-containing protein [Longimonas halophila]